MRITSIRLKDVGEYTVVQESYVIRIQLKVGKILALKVYREDDDTQYFEGINTKHKKMYDKLMPNQKQWVADILNDSETYETIKKL